MSTKILKKVISIILCTVILTCICGNDVRAAEVSLNQSYQSINKKINEALDDNVPPAEIFEDLSESEIKILMKSYDTNTDIQSYGFISYFTYQQEYRKA